MKLYKFLPALALGAIALTGCTDLDETVYSEISSNNFYNSRENVVAMAMRCNGHAHWSMSPRWYLNEAPADQVIQPVRDAHFGEYFLRQFHYHTWDENVTYKIPDEWNGCFAGIGQCNFAIEELDKINASDFRMEQSEIDVLKTHNRIFRAWYYHRLLDAFRNIPFTVSYYDQSKNTMSQVPPKKIFDFIESELKECIPMAYKKENLGTGTQFVDLWTQAGAATILARLYLNAKVYIGEDRYKDCADLCEAIIRGDYGAYKLESRWDAPFDWNNDTSDELIMAFAGSDDYSCWHYSEVYCHTVPAYTERMFNDYGAKLSGHNSSYAVTPSYNPDGTLRDDPLGMVSQKFMKYPEDYRLVKYKNLGNSKREGMFLYGYLEYVENGINRKTKCPDLAYNYYLRDAVGLFRFLPPAAWLQQHESTTYDGDFNSGWTAAKYPHYTDNDAGQRESDFAEIRLAEVYYMLAECKLRLNGDVAGAGELLNAVRKRNYPADSWSKNLYAPDGSAKLDMDEMLDEWGREFFEEGRRRVDLIRYDKFCHGGWWDKQADEGKYTEIFPIPKAQLGANPHLKQNPQY